MVEREMRRGRRVGCLKAASPSDEGALFVLSFVFVSALRFLLCLGSRVATASRTLMQIDRSF